MLALIMAGGYGKRLRPLTDKVPKPLIKVGGKPIIYWQIRWLEVHGIKDFVLLGGYKAALLKSYIRSIGYSGSFGFSVEKKPLGTAGAIKNAGELIGGERSFFIVNGDNVTDLDPKRLLLGRRDVCAISLVPYISTKGIVETRGNRVVGFEEKPLMAGYWFNAGVTRSSARILDLLPEKGSLEQQVFPRLARGGRLSCTKFEGQYFNSVDSFKDMEEIDKALKSGKVRIG